MPPNLNIAVLLSGSGRTLQNLLDAKAAGRLDIDIKLVIASRDNLAGSDRARAAHLPHKIISPTSFPDRAAFSQQIFAALDAAGVDLVVMAGWLSLVTIPDRYTSRVINIHPALLPSFGGQGMFGQRVHAAVLAHGCKISGCTVHFVNNEYDAGPIILQRPCPVLDTDTPQSLAARVFTEECTAYPEALRLFISGLEIQGRHVRAKPHI